MLNAAYDISLKVTVKVFVIFHVKIPLKVSGKVPILLFIKVSVILPFMVFVNDPEKVSKNLPVKL